MKHCYMSSELKESPSGSRQGFVVSRRRSGRFQCGIWTTDIGISGQAAECGMSNFKAPSGDPGEAPNSKRSKPQ